MTLIIASLAMALLTIVLAAANENMVRVLQAVRPLALGLGV